ncbi:colanic acid biosynthesis acetyltransferase WcaB [Escherichia sp. 94.0001]|nr:colanic acid biosynthesis acetyltransferase WcaB [Escherichia sp. 94.0001]MBB2273999.1 colanic acid biosynthesis acetyltransferase WcaB [Escherichia sp. 94.0001]
MLEDLRANSWSLRPCCMVLAYRVAHFCSVWRKKNVLNNLWAAPLLVLYRIITECIFGYEIQAAATIGRRFTIHHGYAVVINKNVVAGDDFTIRHGVTIGNRGADNMACPHIGNGVELGANNMACPHIGNGVELGANVIILGDITIGNNVTVGAGSVVLDAIPDNALVVGEKARVKVIK